MREEEEIFTTTKNVSNMLHASHWGLESTLFFDYSFSMMDSFWQIYVEAQFDLLEVNELHSTGTH
jgi:succinyl-CoA synthetase beta subunit